MNMTINEINNKFKEQINKPMLIASFILFILILLWVVLFKCVGLIDDSVLIFTGNHIPTLNILDRFMYQFRFGTESTIGIHNLEDNLENIIVFLPFGLFLPFLNHKKFSFNLILVFVISFSIELIQLIFGLGGFELIDLVTNILGFILGYGIYKLIKKYLTNRVVNYICLTIVVIFVPVAIYCYTEFFISIHLFKPFFNINNFKSLFDFSKHLYY